MGPSSPAPQPASAHFSCFLLVESLGPWPQHLLVFQQDGRLCPWAAGVNSPQHLSPTQRRSAGDRREGLDGRSWRCREFKRQRRGSRGERRSWQILCYSFPGNSYSVHHAMVLLQRHPVCSGFP